VGSDSLDGVASIHSFIHSFSVIASCQTQLSVRLAPQNREDGIYHRIAPREWVNVSFGTGSP